MNENIKWMCVHKTNSKFEAEAIIGNLEAQHIPAVIVNKKDSSYNMFGLVEIHVPENLQEDAKQILGI